MRRPILKRRDTLMQQVVTVNLLLVVATLFAASLVAGTNLTSSDGPPQFLILALAVLASLLVNLILLRRRFSPLETLIEKVEGIDPAHAKDEDLGLDAPLGRGAYTEDLERLASSFRRLLVRIERERQRSGRLVLRAQEEERKRVARDLHDEVNQSLTAILLRLEAFTQTAPPELAGELREVKALASQAMDELVELVRQLRPTALDDHGLTAAVEGQVRRFEANTGVAAELTVTGEPNGLGPERETVVYRVVQEALMNVSRHADASRVEIDLRLGEAAGGGAAVTVRDDGRGFDPPAARERFGLSGMAERARLVGGELTVKTRTGEGTEIALRV